MFKKILVATALFLGTTTFSNAKPIPDEDVKGLHHIMLCNYSFNIWRNDILNSNEKNMIFTKAIFEDQNADIINVVLQVSDIYDSLVAKLPKELTDEGFAKEQIELILSGKTIKYSFVNDKLRNDISFSKELAVNCVKIVDGL